MSPTPSDASGRGPVSGSGRLPAVSGVRPGSELHRPGAPLFSEAQPKAPRCSLPSPEARRCGTGWTWQTRGAPPSPAEPRPHGWSRARGPLRPPAAYPRGVPGPPWVTGSSGGAGSGAGLEAEARGVSVTSWGTEGLPRSAGLEAGVGAEAGGTGPKDVFWAVTGGVEGPPSRTGPYPGISRWVGGLGAAVRWVSGASGPAEEAARGARGRGPSSAGSGLTSCGSRAASAGPCAGPALAPTPERRLPWGPLRRAAGEGMRGGAGDRGARRAVFPRPALHTHRRQG